MLHILSTWWSEVELSATVMWLVLEKNYSHTEWEILTDIMNCSIFWHLLRPQLLGLAFLISLSEPLTTGRFSIIESWAIITRSEKSSDCKEQSSIEPLRKLPPNGWCWMNKSQTVISWEHPNSFHYNLIHNDNHLNKIRYHFCSQNHFFNTWAWSIIIVFCVSGKLRLKSVESMTNKRRRLCGCSGWLTANRHMWNVRTNPWFWKAISRQELIFNSWFSWVFSLIYWEG